MEDKDFAEAMKRMVKDNGKDVLLGSKTKAYISDYRGQFKREADDFIRLLDAGCAKYINEASDMLELKRRLVERMEDEISISPKKAMPLLDLLGFLLKGDTSKCADAAPQPSAPPPVQPDKPAPSPSKSGAATGDVKVLSPLYATIIRYAVNEGAEVNPDTVIIIIECMKMELEIKAGSAGKVHFLVPIGTQVAAQQPVAQIGANTGAASGSVKVLSPLYATILRYAVNEGAEVSPNTVIIIIESMKIEIEIKAGSAGKVHFLVPIGTNVASQQPVAEIGTV